MKTRVAYAGPAATAIVLLNMFGCGQLRRENAAAFIARPIRASNSSIAAVMFDTSILTPTRDILTLDPLWRAVFGDEAWDVVEDTVPDSSFYTARSAADLSPKRVARGACVMSPPESPFRIIKIKVGGGGNLGFLGEDALGRKFLVKLDNPEYPELGSTSAIVASRIMWALGYNVPPIYLVNLAGTGDRRFDGRRATAALFLDNVRGHFCFDWFRYRRELRGLRLASAWLNDTDRIDSNTLVIEHDGRAVYYLIDFNSCLGSWQGMPKEPWRGYRHAGSLLPPPPNPPPPILSPALGRLAARFQPQRWHPQAPNNAFNHMTAADAAWIAERIRRIEKPHLRAIIAEAHLTNPTDAETLLDILTRRREAILSRFAEQIDPH